MIINSNLESQQLSLLAQPSSEQLSAAEYTAENAGSGDERAA